MGARHMTLADFYADNGFGQVNGRGRASYPEFPSHNTKLQELYKHVAVDGPEVSVIISQLDLARVYQEQGQHLQVAESLASADALLNQALATHAPGGRKWVVLLVAVLALLAVAYIATRRKNPARRLPPPRRRRRRRLAPPAKEDEDSEEDEDEDES
jgi:hypothetical protein